MDGKHRGAQIQRGRFVGQNAQAVHDTGGADEQGIVIVHGNSFRAASISNLDSRFRENKTQMSPVKPKPHLQRFFASFFQKGRLLPCLP
jgi:hypothetical protein